MIRRRTIHDGAAATFRKEVVPAVPKAVPLCLSSLIKNEPIARKILVAKHLPAEVPEHHPARPPPGQGGGKAEIADWVN